MKYVALLRGINIGGNNKINMASLKTGFESLGYINVLTYINSGNVIFSTDTADDKQMVATIEEMIFKNFNLHIKVVIRSKANIILVNSCIDNSWQNDKQQKTDIMFLWDEYANKKSLQLLNINPAVDTVNYCKKAIIWHVLKKDYNQSGLATLAKNKLYKHMTVRNVNTVRKLKILMGD